MTELIEMGKLSTRGQIAIPASIRKEMGLHDGNKVLFLLDDNNTLLVKKVTRKTFGEVTAPLREAARKASMKEQDVPEIVTSFRSKKRR